MKTLTYHFSHTTRLLLAAVPASLLLSCSSGDIEFDATGNFEATEVTVSAQATGELQTFNIQEGQQVTANSVVGLIDTDQLRLKRDEIATNQQQIAATRRQLAASKDAVDSQVLDLRRQVATIQQQIVNARRERERFAELVKDGAAPQKQVDDFDYQIEVLQKQLEATQEQISSANESAMSQSKGIDAQMESNDANNAGMEIRKAQIDDQIGKASIKVPASGTVIEKYVEAGEYVSTGRPLFKVADTGNMHLRAYITSAQLRDIKLGSHVKVYADYGDGNRKEYPGVVTWISSKSEFTPKTILTDDERADLVYAVKINVKNDGTIKMGMYGEVILKQQ